MGDEKLFSSYSYTLMHTRMLLKQICFFLGDGGRNRIEKLAYKYRVVVHDTNPFFRLLFLLFYSLLFFVVVSSCMVELAHFFSSSIQKVQLILCFTN